VSTVLIVDDHPVFRRGLVALLTASGFEVVAEASTAQEAITMSATLRPDIVIMDLGLPDQHGLTATARLLADRPDVRVVVVTLYDDRDTVAAALDAGAIGYVVKDAAPEQLIAALRAAELGASVLSAGLQRPAPANRLPERIAESAGLTRRESAVLDYLAQDLSNGAIAERLGLSSKTVANYVAIVLVKLGARDRHDAARIVRESAARL
jgi:DNA-binding NarL/FixJ family response regulator